MKNITEGINRALKGDGTNAGGQAKAKKAFMLLMCLVFVFLLIFTVAILISRMGGYGSLEDTSISSNPYFKDCKILQKDCKDVDCGFYNSCDGVQPECDIYDCGTEYGIYIKKSNGETVKKKEPKLDTAAIETEKVNCAGSMQIVEQKCTDDKFQAKVSLATKGECKIGSFVLTMEEYGNIINTFQKAEDGTYIVTSDRCGKMARIIPVTESGIALEF